MIEEKKLSYWFYGFSLLHMFFWTTIPTVLRKALPMDALEGFLWGQNWQFGYDRNPWLNAWLTSLAVKIGGQSGWLVYFLSQLSVFLCFFAIWKLGKKFLPAVYALIGVLLLECIQYYTIASVDFNDNVLELGLWALCMLYFYDAIKEKKRILNWVLLGIFAGLSLMAKYYAVVLFAAMLAFLFSTKEGRGSFGLPGIYVGLLVFILVITPHFIWLGNHHFVTLNYALARVSENFGWRGSPFYFSLVNSAAFLPPLILFFAAFHGRESRSLDLYDKKFLICLGILPSAFTFLYAVFWHKSLHVMWGTPLLSLWGLMLVAFIQPKVTKRNFYIFLTLTSIVFSGVAAVYSLSILYANHESSANYPAREIANYAIEKWHSAHPEDQLAYVAGDRYTAGYTAYFMPNQVKACIIEDQINTCPGYDSLKAKGTIFIWRNDKLYGNKNFLDEFRQAKTLVKFPSKKFHWQRSNTEKPVDIGLAFFRDRS